jgi:hypothetical protein
MIKSEGILKHDLKQDLVKGQFHNLRMTAAPLQPAGRSYRKGGNDFHRKFQDLKPAYQAPERDLLTRSTKPIDYHSHFFGTAVEEVGTALTDFSVGAWKITGELEELRGEAARFENDVADTGAEWKKNADLVKRNNSLVDRVEDAHERLTNLEIRTHDRIQAKIGGRPFQRSKGEGGTEPPWGTREQSPSLIDRAIYAFSYGNMNAAYQVTKDIPFLGSALEKGYQISNPIFSSVAAGLTFPYTFGWHHLQDAVHDGHSGGGDFGERLEKDLAMAKGLGQLVTGLAANQLPILAARALGHEPSYDGGPDWLRNWMKESDQAALEFSGLDKLSGDDQDETVSGGIGQLLAGPGTLVAGAVVGGLGGGASTAAAAGREALAAGSIGRGLGAATRSVGRAPLTDLADLALNGSGLPSKAANKALVQPLEDLVNQPVRQVKQLDDLNRLGEQLAENNRIRTIRESQESELEFNGEVAREARQEVVASNRRLQIQDREREILSGQRDDPRSPFQRIVDDSRQQAADVKRIDQEVEQEVSARREELRERQFAENGRIAAERGAEDVRARERFEADLVEVLPDPVKEALGVTSDLLPDARSGAAQDAVVEPSEEVARDLARAARNGTGLSGRSLDLLRNRGVSENDLDRLRRELESFDRG